MQRCIKLPLGAFMLDSLWRWCMLSFSSSGFMWSSSALHLPGSDVAVTVGHNNHRILHSVSGPLDNNVHGFACQMVLHATSL